MNTWLNPRTPEARIVTVQVPAVNPKAEAWAIREGQNTLGYAVRVAGQAEFSLATAGGLPVSLATTTLTEARDAIVAAAR